jgi:Uri superfamily endonuclease
MLSDDQIIEVGKLGEITFNKDFYIYIGSALNGLENRINRHLKKYKKLFWHIDYFLRKSDIIKVYIKISEQREECIIAQKFFKNNQEFKYIDNFGSNDCKCNSHLFYNPDINNIEKNILNLDFIEFNN